MDRVLIALVTIFMFANRGGHRLAMRWNNAGKRRETRTDNGKREEETIRFHASSPPLPIDDSGRDRCSCQLFFLVFALKSERLDRGR